MLVCGQSKMTRMNVEGSKTMPKKTPVQSSSESVRHRAQLAQGGMPTWGRQMWLGPPSDPPPELEEGWVLHTLASCLTKKVRMNFEGQPVKSSARGGQKQAHTSKYVFRSGA